MAKPIKIKNATIKGEGGAILNATITGEAEAQDLDIWGGGNQPGLMPPIYYPPGPVDPGYGHPLPPRPPGSVMPPIYYPPGIWGGGNYPLPTPPIYLPPQPPLTIWGGGNYPLPTPPIYYPPAPVDPGYGHPLPPLSIWGPGDPRPMPPIYWPGYPNLPEPPTEPLPEPPSDKWSWAYDEDLGWVLVPPSGGGKPQPVGKNK